MTSPFTCITCRVAFRDLEVQRQHYKSDWHRYNLKRKVAELPPVTVEEFQKIVIAQRNKDDKRREEETMNCKNCKKIFNTKNQYENHLLSKKHKEKCAKQCSISDIENEILNNDASSSLNCLIDKDAKEESSSNSSKQSTDEMEVDTEVESVDSDEWVKDAENPVKNNDVKEESSSNSSKQSTDEMEVNNEVESVDFDEWIKDVEDPVRNNDCLFCNHHSRSWVRNLKHMTIAHSFFIPDPEYCTNIKGILVYLGEKIFAGYMCIWCNDSGKSFQSAEAARAHMIDKGHCKMLHEGDALAEYAEFYDYSSSYPDAESGDPDAEVEIPELDDSDYQLVLPSGNVIGHRSLMRYYKQNLNPNRAVAIPKSEKLLKVLSQYRALGWTETQQEAVVKKARDIKYMQRIQSKYSTQLQFKANKLQRYFRPQVNF